MALTSKKIAGLVRPGRYRDGLVKGLCLQITKDGVKSWLLRYQRDGKERWAGLGPIWLVDLKTARDRARAAHLKLLDGIDPIDAKRAEKTARALEAAKSKTFRQCADDCRAELLAVL
ncbi:MAG TPA: Arm DNA-binding domain-containing protein, partial [Xanthobacteraceae bacterium]